MSDNVKDLNLDGVAEESSATADTTATEANVTEGVTGEAELSEADILRGELEALRKDLADADAKYMRAMAEVQTVRRRSQQEVNLARAKGMDSVILSVLPVYDDLRRALESAGEDPSSIIPGIERVRDTLKRNLENVGIVEIGKVGEDFNPEFHEALTAMPANSEDEKGKIAQVFESGFMKDDRVIRVARVVVYAD